MATSASLNVEPIIGTLKDAVYSSLDQSIHFPAFREIVFPGDTLAIAVGECIPRSSEILAMLIEYIQTYTEVALEDITIVFANESTASTQTELKNLLDPTEGTTGNIVYSINEVYVEPDGIDQHMTQGMQWEHFEAFAGTIMQYGKVLIGGGTVIHSMT